MLGILYLLLCAAFGMSFVGLAVPDVRRLFIACAPSPKAIKHIPNTLFTVPAGIVTGMMCVPFFNYYVTLGLSYVVVDGDLCKRLGVLITFAFFLWMILTCLILINRKRIKREEQKAAGGTAIEDYKYDVVDSIFYGLVILALTITSTFLMFYTYRMSGDNLMNGYSTFSDLSPHTAMVSSFGKGFNFPTQYMHFSGNGIRYHFLFYFLAGTLQYLGLPIDYALNFPSIISMVCALVLLGLLAVLLSSRRAAFLVAPILVFLRSSLNIFYHIREYMGAGNTFSQTMNEIFASNSWYAVTDYDNWGIWAINVYPNQRHLMLGIAVILVMVILFLPFVRRLGISVSRAESFGEGIKSFIISKNAWLTRSEDPLYPVSITMLACVLCIVMPYFHGSCLIALLLVLFGMAIFSESRLLYLVVAICAVASSYIQTMVFSGGYQNVVTFQFDPGFILEDVTLFSLARYVFIVTGVTLILGGVFAIVSLILDIIRKKPVYRFIVFLCSLTPMLFAFIFKVSLEMLANHKFIQVSLILVDAFVAALIANLLWIPIKRRKASGEASDDEETPELAMDAASTGVRAPEVAAVSAFGESEPVIEETPVIEVIEAHTGIDANIAELSGLPAEATSKDESKTETDEAEVKEEEKPEQLHFGDEKKDSDSEEDDEDAEAKAGVAALAALFGEIDDKKEETGTETEAKAEEEKPAEEKSEDSSDKPAEESAEEAKEEKTEESESSEKEKASEEKADDKSEEKSEETSEDKAEEPAETEEKASEDTDSDKAEDAKETASEEVKTEDEKESDEPVKEAAIEPAHASMRPGSVALSVAFGEEEPVDDGNVEVESADEASDDGEEINAESLKHEPVFKEKKAAAGLSLPAWIALEVAGVILALALMVPLTATGVSEWATYINLNSTPLSVNTNSPVTKWVIENTDPSDVFLTPEWSMNRFILAGRPMYYGWPYYAWSAGHDTYTRDTIYLWLITGCGGDINEFTRYCKERGIRYVIADPEFEQTDYGNGIYFNKRFFEENLTQAAYFAEENTTIYKVY